MHERIQRLLCRAFFLGGCLLPTLATLAWASWHHLPGRVARCEQELSRQLGLQVTFEETATPRPGLTRYRGVHLCEPETKERLARIELLEVTRAAGRLSLAAHSVRFEPHGPALLWQSLAGRLRWTEREALSVSGTELTWDQAEQRHIFQVAQLKIQPTQAGAEALLTFALAGAGTPSTGKLKMVRNRQTVPPTTAWELETGAVPVPCVLLAPLQPEAARLGEGSCFRGAFWVAESASGWDGELTGELSDIKLERLLPHALPHRLSGQARLNVALARFRGGRLEELTASLSAGPGDMSRTLIAACVERMGLDARIPREALEETEPYDRVGLRLWLNSRGLVLEGTAGESESGAVVVAPWGSLNTPAASIARPVTAVVHLLAPASEPLVPLSRQAQYLSRLLPLPSGTAED